jgi:sugar phosphate isomerase/epimerase
MKKDIIKQVQINLPLKMADQYIEKYLDLKINPEIGIDSFVLENISLKQAEKTAQKFKANNCRITMHGPFLDLNPASADPEIRKISRKRIESVAEYAEIFEAESIVFHPGYDFKRYEFLKDEWMKTTCDFFADFAYRLKQKNIVLNVENVYERYSEEIIEVVKAVYENGGGFCFDTGHHFAFGDQSLEKWVKDFGKYIKEIHLHDNDGKNDLHMPPGKGRIDFGPILKFLENKKPDITITLEPHTEEDLWPCFGWMERNNVFG